MAMPTKAQVKLRLRIEHDAEDTDIDLMLTAALGAIEQCVGRPITAESRTFVVERPNPRWEPCDGAVYQFLLPIYPVKASSPTPTIVDDDATAITSFRVAERTGLVTATDDASFSAFPLTITATVGLSLRPDFTRVIEPKLQQAFFDLVADWWQRRNPVAQAEGTGGGVYTQWQSLGVPSRVSEQLEPYRLTRAH